MKSFSVSAPFRVHSYLPGFRAMISEADGSVIGFRGHRLVRHDAPFSESRFKTLGTLPMTLGRRLCVSNLTTRLLRQTPYQMVRTESDAFVTMTSDGILRKPEDSTRFSVSFKDFHGKRPISLCLTPDGKLYFGEYFSNPQREAVRIFRSTDSAASWQCCYEFAPGEVRHVHGLRYDPFRKGLWVFTGDFGPEAQIGWTGDDFASYEICLQRDQQSRVCGGLVRPEGLYFGTDTPEEQNYIYLLDPVTRQVRTLQEVQQSVLFCGEAAGGMFFSTGVEPSPCHTTNEVHVWFSEEGEKWTNVVSVERDRWPVVYFQYPSTCFAQGASTHPRVFLSFQATRATDGGCLVLERC